LRLGKIRRTWAETKAFCGWSAAPGTAYVVVLSGTVALTSRATGRAVLIQPRYGSEVLAGQDPHPPVLHTQAEFDRLIARTELP
jgi:hypothetical protein